MPSKSCRDRRKNSQYNVGTDPQSERLHGAPGFDSSDDDHAPPAPINYLVDHNDDPALAYERESHEDSQLELLRDGLSDLDPRSRDILKRRFLGEPKATLQELADEYGVSAERVRQIEANALKKMRALFAA